MRMRLAGYGIVVAMVIAFGFVQNAEAGKKKFFQVAELTASGGASEVKLNGVKEASWLKVHVMEGTVVINTVVLREGAKKTSIKMAVKLEKGKEHTISLNGMHSLTGIRLSNSGGGVYRVYLKK